MRITIEPTDKQEREYAQYKVIIEHPYDDLAVTDVVEMFAGALKAFGYADQNVNELFGEE